MEKTHVKRRVGRPATGTTTFVTVSLPREVSESVRRFLLKRELNTGERMIISEYIAHAVLERLQRDRAEI